MDKICPCGGTRIILMPDYSSNGLWCDKCGVMIDEENIKLSNKLLSKIQEWNNSWEKQVDNQNKAEVGFNMEALKLAMEINQYYPCLLYICKEKK